MKSIWNIMSVLAIANLLALVGLIGWLRMTDRLSVDRVRAVREVIAETISDQQARLRSAQAAEDADAAAAAEAAKQDTEPVRAADLLRIKLEAGEADQERLSRWRREVEDLRASLQRDLDRLDTARQALQDEQAQFDARKQRLAESEGSELFKKTLATYEGLKPAVAMSMLSELLHPGGAAGPLDNDGADQAVAYLNAMEDRTRTKIIAEFQKQDPALAADLLERLRTRATLASGPGLSGG